MFTKPLAHTFASDATQNLHGYRPYLSVSMVRTYIRKGGHGGDRSKTRDTGDVAIEGVFSHPSVVGTYMYVAVNRD